MLPTRKSQRSLAGQCVLCVHVRASQATYAKDREGPQSEENVATPGARNMVRKSSREQFGRANGLSKHHTWGCWSKWRD